MATRWNLSSVPSDLFMSKATLYAIVGLFAFSMLLFVTGFACWQLGMAGVAAGIYLIAGKIILLAFAAMSVLLVALLLQAIGRGVWVYFRREAVAIRRVSRLKIQQHDAKQRQLLEKRQLYYLAQLKLRRLLAANDKKHRRELFKAISAELHDHTAPGKHKALKKTLKQYYQQADSQAMLALRDKIVCRS